MKRKSVKHVLCKNKNFVVTIIKKPTSSTSSPPFMLQLSIQNAPGPQEPQSCLLPEPCMESKNEVQSPSLSDTEMNPLAPNVSVQSYPTGPDVFEFSNTTWLKEIRKHYLEDCTLMPVNKRDQNFIQC